jgi:hypothetical protein|eukprot:COSAG02_NODE_1466_length_12483_cov_37.157703_10_plen_219_part_00
MSDHGRGRVIIIKSMVNGGDLKRFRLDATQLSAGALLEQVCEQHAMLERGKFTTKLEVKDRPALEPLGTQALRDALVAAGGEAANSVVLRLFSFSVSGARATSFWFLPCAPPPSRCCLAVGPYGAVFGVQDRPDHEATVADEDWQQVVWPKQLVPSAVAQSATDYHAPFGARLCDLLCFGQQVNQLIGDAPSRVRPAAPGLARAEFAHRQTGSETGLQ